MNFESAACIACIALHTLHLARPPASLNGATLNAQGRLVFPTQSLFLSCLSLCRSQVRCLSCSGLGVSSRAKRFHDLTFIMTFLRSSAIPLVVSYVVLMIMSLIVVILRFISKRILQRNIKGHDMLCVVSLVSQ